MKNILLFTFLFFAFLIVSACENGYNSNNDHDPVPVANIRSAINDPVVNCFIEEVHQHNGNYYGGHYNNDGHGHHGLQADNICTVGSCTETSLHQHDEIHYSGHHGSDGHNSHGNGHHE